MGNNPAGKKVKIPG